MNAKAVVRAPLNEKKQREFKWISRWFRSRQYEDEIIPLFELPIEEIQEIYRELEFEALACAKTGNFAPLAVLLDENGPFGTKVSELRSHLSAATWKLVVERLEGRSPARRGRKKLSAAQKTAASSSYEAAGNVPMIKFLIKLYRDPRPTAIFYDDDILGTACDYAARLSGDQTLDDETVRDRVRKTPQKGRVGSP